MNTGRLTFIILGFLFSFAFTSIVVFEDSKRNIDSISETLQVCPAVVTNTSCFANGTWSFSSCQSCNCYSGYGGNCCQQQIGASGECTFSPFSLSSSNPPPYILSEVFNTTLITIVVAADAVPNKQREAILALGLGTGSNGNLNTPPCSCFQKGVTAQKSGQAICTDTWTLVSPWDSVKGCCAIIEDSEMALVYNCDIDYSFTDATVIPGVTKNVRGSLPVQVRFPKQVSNDDESLDIDSDINDVQALLSKQVTHTSSGDYVAEISVSITVDYPYILNIVNVTSDPPLFRIINTTLIQYDPTNPSVTQCSSTSGSSCSQILTFFVSRLQSSTCSFDGSYTSNFSVSCRAGIACSGLSANITVVVNTEDFCPVFQIPINIQGSMTTYADGFTNPTSLFAVYVLPITLAQEVCIKADVALIGNSTGQRISSTFFDTLYLIDGASRTSILLAQQNSQPVECPLFPAGTCQAALLQIDTASQPTAVLSSATSAGACFYLTYSGGGSIGIADDLNIDKSPWTIVAQVAVTYSDSKKRGVEGNGEYFSKLIATIEAVVAPEPERFHSSGSSTIVGVMTIFFMGVFILLSM